MEVQCPTCRQVVRLPDNSAGMTIPCPQCASPIQVQSVFAPSQPEMPRGQDENPYSAPQTSYMPPTVAAANGPIGNQVVDAGPILSHAWEVWKANLGLLVGTFLIMAVISGMINGLSAVMETLLTRQGERKLATAVGGAAVVFDTLVQVYLGIGEVQLILKLLRGEPATIGDLFGGGPRFAPVLGATILGWLMFFFGFLLCVIPGIILVLMFWPLYYLVIDGKTGVLESFSVASTITQGNKGTTFVLWLASLGIMIVGVLALCVGVLFAAPLVSVVWATAYLMMSGQLSTQPMHVQR
jgi:uncharacterized membrane protein